MAVYGGAPYGGAPYAGSTSLVTPTQGIIYNTILDPYGTPVAGANVEVFLEPTAGFRLNLPNEEVARKKSVVTNAAGYWELSLELNTNITPLLTYYRVTEFIPDANGGRRVWNVVVTSTSPTSVFAARTVPLS